MSSSAEEAYVNPDGSTTFEDATAGATGAESDDTAQEGFEDSGDDQPPNMDEETTAEQIAKGTDPAIFIAIGFVVIAFVYYLFYTRSKRKEAEDEAFFTEMDGDKFNIKLPSAVDEYYEVKEKCLKAGWEPGKKPVSQEEAAQGPHRVLAQALMKRCIADIPLVTHIQKESPGMNKLYAQSMCSVNQWKSYQAAENLVSSEVDEVRAEADEIEPGWSQAIWRQAMQYHNMLKNKHEMELKQREAAAQKKLEEEEEKKKPKLTPEEIQKQKELAAEKAAEELIKEEEREKVGKKAFASGGGMKKGFLATKKK